MEEHLDWNLDINSLNCELTRTIEILSKMRHYVQTFHLDTLHYTMPHSHLIQSCQIWGQSDTILRKSEPLQNKALRIRNLQNN